jgi:hypothetical protein
MNYALPGGYALMGDIHPEQSFLDKKFESLKSAVKRLWRILNQKGQP